MTIRWHCLPFESLPSLILYDLLRLRSEVFVVEQNCVFQDIDRQDMDAHHLLGYNEAGELAAYARLFDAGKSYEQASIGRVIVAQPFRQYGLGRELLRMREWLQRAPRMSPLHLPVTSVLQRMARRADDPRMAARHASRAASSLTRVLAKDEALLADRQRLSAALLDVAALLEGHAVYFSHPSRRRSHAQ